MDLRDLATGLGLLVGALFFFSGTLGLLRFPDVYTRLHALTKADNLGLGFVVIALMFQATSWLQVLKLLSIWILVLVAGAAAAFLIAQPARRKGVTPWTR